MKKLVIAAAMALAPSLGWAAELPCGNMVHNLVRSRECEAYAGSDWEKQKALRDIRAQMLEEWIAKIPLASAALDVVLKEADIKRSWALTRDAQIFGKDADQWKSRGCAELPLCTDPRLESQAPAPAPAVKAKPRNRRTGGNYCGPRDRRNGYCS